MQKQISEGRENKTLDLFKAIVCILVTQTHLPSVFSDPLGEFYYCQWFFRFCVPFFFVCSGYFFYRAKDKKRTLKRILWLFVLSNVLYLPAMLKGAADLSDILSKLRWNLVFGYEHLWYLSATLEGMILWYVLEKIPVISRLFRNLGIPVSILLLLTGVLLDEYYHLIDNPLIRLAGEFLSNFGGPRNVVFMGFPMLMLGGAMARYESIFRKIPTWLLPILWLLFRVLAFVECKWLLETLGSDLSTDLTFFGWVPALILLELSFRFQIPIPDGFAKLLRRMAEYVYVLHPLVAMLISAYLPLSPMGLWISTIAMCSALYLLLEKNFILKK